MKSKEEILDKYLKDNHGPAETYRDILKAMKEYAQQSQPSGMRWVRASKKPDPGKSKWYIVKTDTHAGRCYCGDKYAMSRYCIENKISMDDLFYLDESSPASNDYKLDNGLGTTTVFSSSPAGAVIVQDRGYSREYLIKLIRFLRKSSATPVLDYLAVQKKYGKEILDDEDILNEFFLSLHSQSEQTDNK